MKLEINQFIRRTRSGKIARIIDKIDNSGSLHSQNIVYKLDDNSLLALNSQKIKNTSHNIIDLIEVGDYVNGYLVTDVYRPTGKKVFRIEIERDTLKGHIIDDSNQIKTILTKEQFENNCYKLGDE